MLKGMPVMFQQQDHVAHIRVHAAMLWQPATATNPQAFMAMQAHAQEHIAMHSRDGSGNVPRAWRTGTGTR